MMGCLQTLKVLITNARLLVREANITLVRILALINILVGLLMRQMIQSDKVLVLMRDLHEEDRLEILLTKGMILNMAPKAKLD